MVKMDKIRILSALVAMLAICYAFVYTLPTEMRMNILNAFSFSISLTGFLTEEEYLGSCLDPETNQKPVFNCTIPGQINITEKENFLYQVCYEDPENDSILVEIGIPPGETAWNTIIQGINYSGFVNITPNNDDVGIYNVRFTLRDACHQDDVSNKLVTFYVNNTNDPPVIINFTPEITAVFHENETIVFDVEFDDPDLYVDPRIFIEYFNLSWFINDNLVNKTENTRENYSEFEFYSDFCSAGIWEFEFEVKDINGSSDTQTWDIEVLDVNRAPYQNKSLPDNITINEDEPEYDVLNLSTYFSDLDLEECGELDTILNFTSNHPELITINQTSKHLSLVPSKDWYGNETVIINVTDGKDGIQSEPLLIIVEPVPDPPIIEEIEDQRAAVGFSYSLKINASDPDNLDPENPVDFLTYGDNSSFFDIQPETGLISFIPTIDLIGEHKINITVNDSYGLSNSTVFNLLIFNNSLPVFEPESCNDIVTHEKNLTVIEFKYYDPDGDDINISVDTDLFDIDFSNNTYANASFTPLNKDVGNHTIKVTLTDIWDMSSNCVFKIEVIDINNPPELLLIESPQEMRINYSYYLEVNAIDEDNDILTYYDNSTFFDINSTTGIIDIENLADVPEGNYSVNISVCDPYELCDSQEVLFVVRQNNPPYFIDFQDVYFCEEDEECVIEFKAEDPENDSVFFSVNDTRLNIISERGIVNFLMNKSMLIPINITVVDEWGLSISNTTIINITDKNDPPVFLNQSTLNLETWVNFTTLIEIFIYDEEGDDVNISMNDTRFFELTKINSSYFNASFLPEEGTEGNYIINITATDGEDNSSVVMNLIIHPENKPPRILSVVPEYETFQGTENMPSFFSVNVSEQYIDTIELVYLIDNVLVKNYTYIPEFVEGEEHEDNITLLFELDYLWGWYDQGFHTVEFIAKDSLNQTDSFNWTIYVINNNREPIALKKVFNSTMDLNWVNESETDNLSYTKNPGFVLNNTHLIPNPVYCSEGYWISPLISFNTKDIQNVSIEVDVENIGNFTYELPIYQGVSEINCTTSYDIQYRNSLNDPPLQFIHDLNWNDWSDKIENSSIFFNGTVSSRYWQVKVNLYSDCKNISPEFKGLYFNYEPVTKSLYEGVENAQWININDFFYDPDEDDSLSFEYATAIEDFIVTPDPDEEPWPSNGWLYLSTPMYFTGENTIKINVSDTHSANESVDFKVNIIKRPALEGTQIRYEVKTKTEIVYQEKIVEKEVPKYESFNLVVPDHMTMYPNDTIIVPITLDNFGNKTLENIRLSVNSSRTDVEVFLTKDFVQIIRPETQEKTEAIITTKNVYGDFDITIQAEIGTPEFNDTAKVLMSSLKRGEHNETQLYTKVSYTEDLLQSNKQCLELNEMVSEAKALIENSKYSEAERLLDSTVQSCKYLVATQTETQSPSKISGTEPVEFNFTMKNNIFIIITVITILFILLIVLIYWITTPRKTS